MSFTDVLLQNNPDKVKEFFDSSTADWDIDTVNADGYTPLFYACMKASISPKIAEILLTQLDASVDAKGKDDETPLYIAVYNRRIDIVKLLLSYGADVNMINSNRKETVLHVAARLGFTDILSSLLSAGANVDSVNAKKETPLYAASRAGCHETVYLLLKAGADGTLVNEDGHAPLYVASEKGFKHVVVLLKSEKISLENAKVLADIEYKKRPVPIMTSEEMQSRASLDSSFVDEVRRHSALSLKDDNAAPMKVLDIKIPEAKVRTHNPLTGASQGPCRSLEEVGYDAPPSIPKELQNRSPPKLQRIGGTSMVVGTGTEEGGREPIQLDVVDTGAMEFYVPQEKR